MIQIPSAIYGNIQSAFDDVLNNITGRSQCTLFYPPLQVPCPSIAQHGNIATDYWVTGDPQWIHSQQLCPLCNGTNFLTQEQTDTITLVITWKPSQFNREFPSDNRHAEGVIQTRGFTSDLTKILNCTRMQSYNELGTDVYNFKLLGEPVMSNKIIKDRYAYCLWKRV